MFFVYLFLFVIGIPCLIMLVSVFIGIPCLPTHKKQAKILIDLCDIKSGMKMVDLGSGHGRLVLMAAKKGANVVGYELNPFLVLLSRWLIWKNNLSHLAKIRFGSLYRADIADADVVTAFLFKKPMIRLANGLFKQLKQGAKVISYVFEIKDWKPIVHKEGIFIYQKNID